MCAPVHIQAVLHGDVSICTVMHNTKHTAYARAGKLPLEISTSWWKGLAGFGQLPTRRPLERGKCILAGELAETGGFKY
jgi:hypothetical protein